MLCNKKYGKDKSGKPLICKKNKGHRGSHSIRKTLKQIINSL